MCSDINMRNLDRMQSERKRFRPIAREAMRRLRNRMACTVLL